MIDDIGTKSRLYTECIEIIGLQEVFKKFKDISCFSEVESLKLLHQANLNLWTTYH